MIKEIQGLKQSDGSSKSRWFTSEEYDIYVFFNASNEPTGFHFCYEKQKNEKILIFDESNGYQHAGIDNGEREPGRLKATPVLVPDGSFDKISALSTFRALSENMDPGIRDYITKTIEAYE
jgi:hypothetical protein